MDTAEKPTKTIRFRGRSFLALVLAPELPLADWFAEFDRLRERSPSFFTGRAVVLDVHGLGLDKEGLQSLVADLFARNVRVMGVEGAKASALGLGLPPAVSGGRLVDDLPGPVEEAPASSAAAPDPAAPREIQPVQAAMPVTPSLVIEAPVRSGQSVVFPEGDVTVIGSVASGAEIIAGGSIHVYGALRGRALAGSAGNGKARIFSHKFEAELVAIDGLYQTADELTPDLLGRPVQIWLRDDMMMTAALD